MGVAGSCRQDHFHWSTWPGSKPGKPFEQVPSLNPVVLHKSILLDCFVSAKLPSANVITQWLCCPVIHHIVFGPQPEVTCRDFYQGRNFHFLWLDVAACCLPLAVFGCFLMLCSATDNLLGKCLLLLAAPKCCHIFVNIGFEWLYYWGWFFFFFFSFDSCLTPYYLPGC